MDKSEKLNKIKILIVMHGAGKGGVEASLANLCKYLDKERFEPIVAMPEDGPLKAYLDDIGVRTVIAPLEWWTPLRFFYGDQHYYRFLSGLKDRVNNLVRIIRENDINLVHSSTLTVADGAIAARLSGRPHIWHIHGRFDGISSAFGTYLPIDVLYPMVNSLSTRIVAVSQIVKDFLSQYMPLSKIEVIYNGIDLDKFNGKTSPARSLPEEFPSLRNKVLVGLVGRIARVKGIEDYVEAAIRVLKARDDVSFLIIGPEEDKVLAESVKNTINSLHLADKIVFTGYREDIPALLRGIDLVVCPSLKEGFSYSCLEAMAASKPIVTTKCGGPEELVVHGDIGYLVEVGRPNELAEAIKLIIGDPDKLKSMGTKGRQRSEQIFDARIYARNFERLYLEVMKQELPRELWTGPWQDLFIHLATSLGALGEKVIHQEHEIKDLRNFEALFKKNVFYRSLRKCIRFLKHEKGQIPMSSG